MTINELPPVTYATIAQAEAAIIAAGYTRDAQRHIWVQAGTGKTAKVVRTVNENNIQFSVQWG